MRVVSRLAVVGLLSASVGCSGDGGSEPGTMARFFAALRVRFTSGKAELQRSLEAKKAAKSFRMKVNLTLHPGSAMVTEVEVSCPDRERITTHIGSQSYQTVRVGSDGYIQEPGQPWIKQQILPEAYPCGENPGAPSPWAMINEGRDMSTVIASMTRNPRAPITINAASLSVVSGNTCQPWVVSMQHPAGGAGKGMVYTLCLDPQSRLPVQLVLGSGGMVVTYSDWNEPLQIDVPTEAKMATETTKAH